LRLGDVVEHTRWGRGIVVQLRGEGSQAQVSVAFPDTGIKHLILEYAKLRRVGG
jgi:DNA helicase-2/ATP-dependent DNA helicase PcrA